MKIDTKVKPTKIYRAIPNVKSGINFEYYTTNKLVAELYEQKYGLGMVIKTVALKHAVVYTLSPQGEEFNHIYNLVDQMEIAFEKARNSSTDYTFTRFGTKIIIPALTDGIVIENIIDVPGGELPSDPDAKPDQWKYEARKYKSNVYILPK